MDLHVRSCWQNRNVKVDECERKSVMKENEEKKGQHRKATPVYQKTKTDCGAVVAHKTR